MTRAKSAIALSGALILGCSDDAARSEISEEATVLPASRSSELYACEETQFEEQRPLIGPGFDRARGGILGAAQPSYVVHTTLLFPKPEQDEAFRVLARGVLEQLESTPGQVAYALGADTGCGLVRTLGIWASEQAMYTFMGTGAHVRAMAMAEEVAQTGKTTHFTVTSDELAAVDWARARRELEDEPPKLSYE
jgi:hypothetical protein